MKKFFNLLMTAIMAITMFCSTSIGASAATYSSGTSTRTITVVTKANWSKPGSESITLSQTKGIRTKKTYNIFTRKTSTKTKKYYGTWKIVAKSTDGKHTVKNTMSGSSCKVKLKPNKTYKITVTWDGTADTIDSVSRGTFTTYPTWKVKSSYKVSRYY